jgi:hypothetical protein
MNVELKKISFSERMSEETSCFVADLFINGKKVGYCKNDGRGGCTEYHGNTKEDNVLIAKAEKYFKSLPKVHSEEYNFDYDQSLENVIDDCLTAYLKDRAIKSMRKKLQKKFSVAICYGKISDNGAEYATTYWKGRTLAEIPLQYLQKAYDDVKAKKLQDGDVILNDNLEALGVKL